MDGMKLLAAKIKTGKDLPKIPFESITSAAYENGTHCVDASAEKKWTRVRRPRMPSKAVFGHARGCAQPTEFSELSRK